ncbi:helix-turn-helix domain-containing protein [Leuconostoc mesenteroides]|uniref:helix-turn-helix domain-containing protein n=1 Tax=Leuconostoc mesenteroides TaxID=1245 RepID=UPI00236163B4|nr:helix-turn-helix transcriptional regulator [Leuconostoc mesenteroides]
MLANKQALFDIRMQKRLTQKDLALASGLSERTINTYESDIDNLRNARYKNVEKVANALGVSVDEIFLSTVSEKPKQKQTT